MTLALLLLFTLAFLAILLITRADHKAQIKELSEIKWQAGYERGYHIGVKQGADEAAAKAARRQHCIRSVASISLPR
jgi:hypothetical protein